MTVKELIEKLQNLPPNATVEMCYREYVEMCYREYGDADGACGFLSFSDIENIYLYKDNKKIALTRDWELWSDINYREVGN